MHQVEAPAASPTDPAKGVIMPDRRLSNGLMYGLFGVAGSLAYLIALYWALRLDSSLTNFVLNTYPVPHYFWPYVIITLATVVLFGVNVSLFAYYWRKFGPPRLTAGAGTGAGSAVGVAASACPVCGSTILAAIGIADGLVALPLLGLELKALALVLMVVPVWLMRRDFLRLARGGDSCPAAKDHRFKSTDWPWAAAALAVVLGIGFLGWNMLKIEPIVGRALMRVAAVPPDNTLFEDALERVAPKQGFQSSISLRDSVAKLVEHGVIDREKFEAIYKERGGLPEKLKALLDGPSDGPIRLTRENSVYYVNLLWPLGLANYMSANRSSPINGTSLFNFASTGGWTLGKEENGGAYFNKFKIVELTPEQEALVVRIAQNTYRPCCNNSTFFQDCNHGSALLGLLQLGASQGLSEDALYREALAINAFWFPDTYTQTALYFGVVKNVEWDKVDAKVAMGKDFSSGTGSYTVQYQLAGIPNLFPPQSEQEGGNCGT